MADTKKVNPNCINRGNPYHECAEQCYMKVANGKPRKSSFKNSGYQPSGNDIPKRVPPERRANPKCSKASNPYHECGDQCSGGLPVVQRSMNRKESGSAAVEAPQPIRRRTPNHQTKPTHVLDNAKSSVPSAVVPSSPLRTPSKVPEIEEIKPSSLPFSGQIRSEEFSFDKGQVMMSSHSPSASGAVTPVLGQSSDGHATKENSKGSFASTASSKEEEADDSLKTNELSSENPVANDGDISRNPLQGSISSGVSETDRSSSKEDAVSESRVPVGKYRVKLSVSSTLLAILAKYGDIAENCILESVAMRSYYLESVCSVVEELQSLSFMTLTNPKVVEMEAVVKDLEASRINVGWLRGILDRVSEATEFVSNHQAVKVAKSESNRRLEAARKEMELRNEELVKKEKEVSELKAGVAEMRRRMEELEAEAVQMDETVAVLDSQIETFGFRTLLQELL